MHGHGVKLYLCKYEGCERSVAEYGFRRYRNLLDYMKRIYNDTRQTKSNVSESASLYNRLIKGMLYNANDYIEMAEITI